jgi:hypothetical protein
LSVNKLYQAKCAKTKHRFSLSFKGNRHYIFDGMVNVLASFFSRIFKLIFKECKTVICCDIHVSVNLLGVRRALEKFKRNTRYSSFACDVIAAMLNWKTITKDLSLASFVYGTNMAAMSLDSLGNDCKPRIGK